MGASLHIPEGFLLHALRNKSLSLENGEEEEGREFYNCDPAEHLRVDIIALLSMSDDSIFVNNDSANDFKSNALKRENATISQ